MQPPAPSPPSRPKPSNVLTFALLGVMALGALAFGYLLFGEFLVIAVAIAIIIGLVGLLHYITWGRALTEQANREPPPDDQPDTRIGAEP